MAGADRSSRAASAWRRMLERSGGRHRPGCHTWWALRRACAAASPSHGWRRGLDFQVAAHGAAAASCSDRPSGRHDRARSWPPLRQSFPTGSSSGPGARAAARAAGRGVRPARRSGRRWRALAARASNRRAVRGHGRQGPRGRVDLERPHVRGLWCKHRVGPSRARCVAALRPPGPLNLV